MYHFDRLHTEMALHSGFAWTSEPRGKQVHPDCLQSSSAGGQWYPWGSSHEIPKDTYRYMYLPKSISDDWSGGDRQSLFQVQCGLRCAMEIPTSDRDQRRRNI